MRSLAVCEESFPCPIPEPSAAPQVKISLNKQSVFTLEMCWHTSQTVYRDWQRENGLHLQRTHYILFLEFINSNSETVSTANGSWRAQFNHGAVCLHYDLTLFFSTTNSHKENTFYHKDPLQTHCKTCLLWIALCLRCFFFSQKKFNYMVINPILHWSLFLMYVHFRAAEIRRSMCQLKENWLPENFVSIFQNVDDNKNH